MTSPPNRNMVLENIVLKNIVLENIVYSAELAHWQAKLGLLKFVYYLCMAVFPKGKSNSLSNIINRSVYGRSQRKDSVSHLSLLHQTGHTTVTGPAQQLGGGLGFLFIWPNDLIGHSQQ